MADNIAMMLLVVGVLGAGAVLFMKRCDLLGICDDEDVAPLPPEPLPPAPEGEEGEGEEGEESEGGDTVIINNEYGQPYPVPVPYPVPSRRRPPVIVRPPPQPYPRYPACVSRISRHGRTYTLTNLSRMPEVMIMIFPPQYIKEGKCIYQLTNLPRPKPDPRPLPRPIEVSKSCCKCKTTGYDNEVRCSSDGGKTWSTNTKYRYDITKSLNDCVTRNCKRPTPWPVPGPKPVPTPTTHKCTDFYCKMYPSRCPHCPPKTTPPTTPPTPPTSTANYGTFAFYGNRMSFG